MSKEVTETFFDCGECKTESSIKLRGTFTNLGGKHQVFRCTNCKHQYGMKGLLKLNERNTVKS